MNTIRIPVLTIAGSDSSGGAGIQADLKTMLARTVYGMSAITALTAQNTTGVQGILPVPAAFLQQQLEAVCSDLPPQAVKIGMLASADQVPVICQAIRTYALRNIVVDPVMVATTGATLTQQETICAMQEQLFPLATLLTPLSAASLLVFCLLYTPCVAAIASVKRELGGKWAAGVVIGQCVIAWLMAGLVYGMGSLFI